MGIPEVMTLNVDEWALSFLKTSIMGYLSDGITHSATVKPNVVRQSLQ